MELTPEDFDALISIIQFFHAESELPNEVFDTVLDQLVHKIENHGGEKCAPSQIQDIVYEAEVALLLSRSMPGFARLEIDDHNRPDHIFKVHFFANSQPAEVAIECKNIRRGRSELRDLVRSVAQAIKNAVRQHGKRNCQFDDLLIFIDLPISILAFSDADFYKLIVNVWHQLEIEHISGIDETNVIFTATSQQGMADYLTEGPNQPRGLNLLRPFTVNRISVDIRTPRLLFLSCLFRESGANANVNNWCQLAVNIVDPSRYLFEVSLD